MSFRLVSIPDVVADLQSAFHWYQSQQPNLGLDFMAEVRMAVTAAREAPLQFPIVGLSVHRVQVKRFPYGVFFLIDAQAVIVLAVLDLRRHPKTWRARARHYRRKA